MEKLRQIRKENGITMKQLAVAVGVAEASISFYETGKRQPDIETLCRLANYFNVSIDYLVGNNAALTASENGEHVFAADAEERELLTLFRSISREAKDAIIGNARTAKLLYPKKDD